MALRRLTAGFRSSRTSSRRCSSTSQITKARATEVKSKEFYEEASRHRNYFYVIDLKGQLFLEDMVHRNFTTCSKDPKFLYFFFKQLRANDAKIEPASFRVGGKERLIVEPYSYLSTCGVEINFVAHEDPYSALGFVGLEERGSSADLIYPGHVAKEQLNPAELLFNSETGRLYHVISALPNLIGRLGLLHPSLSLRFADLITCENGQYFFKWEGRLHILRST